MYGHRSLNSNSHLLSLVQRRKCLTCFSVVASGFSQSELAEFLSAFFYG